MQHMYFILIALLSISLISMIRKNRYDLKRLEELKLSERRYRTVLNQADEMIWEWQKGNPHLYISENYLRKCCQSLEHKVHTVEAVWEMIHPSDRAYMKEKLSMLTPINNQCQLEVRVESVQGHYIWMLIRATRLEEKDGKYRIIGMAVDIDETRKRELELIRKSTYDDLTQTFNRRTIQNKIVNEMKLIQYRQKEMAVLFLDLDRFKEINDNYGHTIGDTVLRESARIMRLHTESVGYVGRYGGDEFLIYIELDYLGMSLQAWIQDLIQDIESYTFYTSSKEPFTIKCSIGYAIYPQHGQCFEELLWEADCNMYTQKKKKCGTIE